MANITIKETAGGRIPAKFCIFVGGLSNHYYHSLEETLARVKELIEHGTNPARIQIRSEYMEYHDFTVEYDNN